MAAAAAIVDRGAAGDLFTRIVDVTLDANYPAGGYALTPQQLGLGANGQIMFVESNYSKTGGWESAWDYTNGKLQIFDSSGAVSAPSHEAAPGTVLTGVVVRLMAWGKGQG